MYRLTPVQKLILFLVFFLMLVFLAIQFIMPYFLPFVIALILAVLIDPLVSALEKKKLGRGFAVFFSLAIFLLIFFILVVVMVSQVYIQLERLIRNLPEYERLGQDLLWIADQDIHITELLESLELPAAISKAIDDNLESLYQQGLHILSSIIDFFLDVIRALPNIFIITIIVFIATFFISRDRNIILQAFLGFIPVSWKEDVRSLLKEIATAVFGFIRAISILISITIIISIVGLELLSSEYSLIMAFAAGILDLIPVIGPSLVYIPWAIISFVTGDIFFGIGLLVIYSIIAVVRQIAEARILGQSIGIHPLATLIAIYVGLRIFGVSGFFIGPGFLIVLKAIHRTGFLSTMTE